METLDTERDHPTFSPVDKKDLFVNLRNDSAYDSISGSASDHSLLQSSLSSIASFESKDANSLTEEDDEEDVFSDQTVTYSDDDNQSQILSTPKKVTSVSAQSQTNAATPKPVICTFHSWEDYHRADKSRTGLIFLWMYLKKIPGREADAAATLAKYYGHVIVVKETAQVTATVQTEPTIQIKPDPTGFKSDGNTTDDEPNELSRLYQRKHRKKATKRPTPVKGDTNVPVSASFENEITHGKMALVAKLDLPSDIKSVSIYAERNETRPIKVMLETEKSNWSVLMKPDEQSCTVKIHDRVDTKDTDYLVTDKGDFKQISINKNAWANNKMMNAAKVVEIFTDDDWSKSYTLSRDDNNNLIGLVPSHVREIKFRLDGRHWTTLECLGIVANDGWNANNTI